MRIELWSKHYSVIAWLGKEAWPMTIIGCDVTARRQLVSTRLAYAGREGGSGSNSLPTIICEPIDGKRFMRAIVNDKFIDS